MRIISIIILSIFHPLSDTLQPVTQNIEFLYQLLLEQTEEKLVEDLTLSDDDDASHEDLLEDYLFYLENPLNINSEEVIHLEEIGLLSVFQTEALRQYRRQFGDLLFIDELLMMEEFNEAVVAVIGPLVYFGKSEKAMEQEQPGLGRMLTQGRHQVTLNYAQKTMDTTTKYLGDPLKLQVKYVFHYKQRLRFGFALEKDAGEPWLRHFPGFDFYGFHVYASDIKLTGSTQRGTKGLEIKDLAIGDYLLSFGQGLTLWSGMSFGKASGGSSPMKRAAGVRPKASASEGNFFRGAATTFRYRDWYATAFYSLRYIDATIVQNDTLTDELDDAELVSALQETGYHRTLNELEKRHAVRQQVFGGHLCYAGPQLEVGFTAYHLRLNKVLELKSSKYNQFYFQGDRLTDFGLDFRWFWGKAVFFGELSRSDNGAFAGLVGMTLKPRGYINFSLLYRNYDKQYQNLLNGAFGESSRGQGEEGVYLGLQCAPAPRWDLLAYADFFRLTWLSSQVYNPSWGQEYSIKINHQISRNASMQFRFKSKTKMKNSADDHVFCHYPIFYTKRSMQFQVNYNLFGSLYLGNKAAYSHYFNDDGIDSRGCLICQDVAYKPDGKPYSLSFRYALFSSNDYNSRITLYENDVLGAFSIPSLSGTGSRIYLLGKVKLFNCLSLYSRIGVTVSDEIKTDFKIELVWKQ